MPSDGQLDNTVVAAFIDPGGAEDASHYSAQVTITGNSSDNQVQQTVQPVYDSGNNEF